VLGEEPSAAQNGTVTKTCTQCGAIDKGQGRLCCFCEAPLVSENSAKNIRASAPSDSADLPEKFACDEDWKRELEHRVDAYRSRRKRLHSNADQGAFPFDGGSARKSKIPGAQASGRRFSGLNSVPTSHLTCDESPLNDPAEAAEEFAFAIGIGPRPHSERAYSGADGSYRVEIDLSEAPLPSRGSATVTDSSGNHNAPKHPLERKPTALGSAYFPPASLQQRCLAGFVDAIFLLFAYGGFLTLFGSLGGHFSFSKFSAVVYAATLILFYVQYFALFTIFGGMTPGMMLCHLELVNFDEEVPSPRQLLQRSFGYTVSGATFLLGFFWALWDEDHLTWQDRISNTYLTSSVALSRAESFSDGDTAEAAHK
jgi:uncharacterized RDD family membrane protein YckC